MSGSKDQKKREREMSAGENSHDSLKKRKRVVVTIQDKLNAIRSVDAGQTLIAVAKKYNVGPNTVGDWRRNRKKLEEYGTKSASIVGDRKSMKLADFPKTNEAVYTWFQMQRSAGMSISGPIIIEKAKILSKKFPEEGEKFVGSEGWLGRWKTRYGIRQLNLSGEKLSADEVAASLFCDEIQTIIEKEGYSLDQVYNCDESGLNYRMLPTKTLASKEEISAPGAKKNKERITIMACSNASGAHRLPLMVIGKSARPRALNKINPKNIPVYYKNQRSAWMNTDLFKIWFEEQFVPKVRTFLKLRGLPEKAILLLDNAPSHPDEETLKCGEIIARFLPPNVTSLVQPMDQGVLESLKKRYRKNLLRELLLKYEDEGLKTRVRGITIKDAIFWLADAWDSMPESTLRRSWSKLLDLEDRVYGESVENVEPNLNTDILDLINNIPGGPELSAQDIEEWMQSDEPDFTMTDDEVAKLVLRNEDKRDGEDEPEDETVDETISFGEAFNALETSLKFVEQQDSAESMDIAILQKWRNFAALKRISAPKQQVITAYF